MVSPDTNRQLLRILLIDDDPISREVLAMMLEMHGFPVASAEDGAQALQLLHGAVSSVEAPELILMDTQMPGLSGLELVRALRGCSNARIVAISGSAVSEEIRQATDGFLLKPIQVESLVALLDAGDSMEETPAASVQPSDASKLIDPVVLGKFKAMMPPAAVREIYDAVASDLKTRLVALEAAMDSKNETEVRRIAHAIKGGCGMVGLSSATEAAARLETSDLSEAWPEELMQLHFALGGLQGILVDGLL